MKEDRASLRRRRLGGWLLLALLAASLPAHADTDPCREWQDEHGDWMARVVRLYLTGAPRQELDAALFELLQREAYLTSCDTSVQLARGDMVGWRLVDRAPGEYGSAVLESVLERAGFDVGLRQLFEVEPPSRVAVSRQSSARRGRARGSN